jgi:hypothetical protein
MTSALLIFVILLATASAVLLIASLRRRDGLQGLTALILMVLAAVPAAVYASLNS